MQNLIEPWHRSSETKTLKYNPLLDLSRTKLDLTNWEKKLERKEVMTGRFNTPNIRLEVAKGC